MLGSVARAWSLPAAVIAVGLMWSSTTAAAATVASQVGEVQATVETPALFNDQPGGFADADDVAIWLHPGRSEGSLAITTAKNGGINVYNLNGQLVQHLDAPGPPGPGAPPSRFDNVDVVYGFEGNDYAVVADRGRDQIRSYRIRPANATAPLLDVTSPRVPFVFSADQNEANGQKTAYGLAATTKGNNAFAYVSRAETGDVARVRLVSTDRGISYQVTDRASLPARFPTPIGPWAPCQERDGVSPGVKGMVVDPDRNVVYLAQEQVGVWRTDLGLGKPQLFERTREFGVPYDRVSEPATGSFTCTLREDEDPGVGGTHLSADIGSPTLYERPKDPRGYLLVSSQGDGTMAVFDRQGANPYISSFTIADGPAIDGVEEVDGAMVLNVPLGPRFPKGMLVVQDTSNVPVVLRDGTERPNTNFKFIPWQDVAATADPPLAVRTGGSPRD